MKARDYLCPTYALNAGIGKEWLLEMKGKCTKEPVPSVRNLC
jgi:hypothetical protein